MLLFAEIWSSSFHQWKYERKIAIRLCSFLCRTKVKTSLYFFLQLLLLVFMTFFQYGNVLFDKPKNLKQSANTTAMRRWSWFWLLSGSNMQTVYPCVVSQLHSVRNPSQRAYNYPIFLSRRFHRPIYYQFEFRIQTPTGPSGPITSIYVTFNWHHQARRLKRKTAIFFSPMSTHVGRKWPFFSGKEA